MSKKLLRRATLAVGLGVVLSWPGCLSPGWLTAFGSPAFWGTATAVFAGDAASCAVGPCGGESLSLAELLDPLLPAGQTEVVSQ